MKNYQKKTNPRLTQLISLLKNTSREQEANIWREIASRLETPGRNYAEVNISKINRYANEGETILVPGGVLESSVQVAALNFSESAVNKIRDAQGQCMTIEELLANNPKGSRVRILR
jgi:large subunit ribosomal protein L18e